MRAFNNHALNTVCKQATNGLDQNFQVSTTKWASSLRNVSMHKKDPYGRCECVRWRLRERERERERARACVRPCALVCVCVCVCVCEHNTERDCAILPDRSDFS